MWPSVVLTLVLLIICSADALITVIDPVNFNIILDWFNDEPIVLNNSLIEGYIEPTNPPDACQNVAAPSFPAGFRLSKIALINDTNCNLMTKVCYAQAVGYDAVVISRTPVFSNKLGQLLSDMKWKRSDPEECSFNITVTLINSDDAIVIRDQYAYDSNMKDNFLVKISQDKGHWALQLLLCFSISTLPFVVCALVGTACRHLQAKLRIRRENNAVQDNLNRLFPIVKFHEGDPYEDCAICWGHFTSGEKLRVLKCSHTYHPKCIDAWIIKYQRKCPLCKRLVVLGDSFDATNPDPSESTPLLASSNASNYTSGPSPTSNRHVGFPNVPDHAPENSIQQSADVAFGNSVNHDAQPYSEQSVQPGFIV